VLEALKRLFEELAKLDPNVVVAVCVVLPVLAILALTYLFDGPRARLFGAVVGFTGVVTIFLSMAYVLQQLRTPISISQTSSRWNHSLLLANNVVCLQLERV
jgi:hypothetical protein